MKFNLLIQFILTFSVIGFWIASYFNKSFSLVFEILLILLMFVLSYNNHKTFKRKYMTYIYLIFGIVLIISLFI